MFKSTALFFGVFIFGLVIYSSEKKKDPGLLHVGDIEFDPSTDNPNFKICGRIFQYYNFEKGNFSLDKKLIRQHFFSKIRKGSIYQNGYITIRFIVNCEGVTDRFRIYEIDRNWKKTKFDDKLKNQLLTLTKELKGWKPGEFPEFRQWSGKFDFYQYLTFKIRNGELMDITP